MSKIPLLVIGSGGHASVVIDAIERQNIYQIVGLFDSFRKKDESSCGYLILGGLDQLSEVGIEKNCNHIFVAIGDNFSREKVSEEIKLKRQFKFASIVHPNSVVARSASVADGVVVMPGAVIGPNCKVGEGCIVNTRASLDHDGLMDAYSSLAPGVHAGGTVQLGRGSAIGIGASIKHSVKIGKHTLIGAGSTVLQDIGDEVVAFGTPAQVMRKRVIGEKYL